jgi:hypothetical protein
LYVYVANNPLKYRDPTGHVKFTFKLKNTGKKAVELNVAWVLSLPAMMAVLP